MLRFLCLAGFVLQLILHAKGECQRIKVSGAVYQKSREGVYEAVYKYYCFGRPVYKQKDWIREQNYFYYYGERYKWNGWQIGSAPCVNKAAVAARDDSATPDRVTAIWEEYFDSWFENNELKVECDDQNISSWAIAGIVLGGIILVVLSLSLAGRLYRRFKSTSNVNDNGTQEPDPYSDYSDIYDFPTMTSEVHSSPSYYDAIQEPPSYEDALRDNSTSTLGQQQKPPSYESIIQNGSVQSERISNPPGLFYTTVSGSSPVIGGTEDASQYETIPGRNHTNTQPPLYDNANNSSANNRSTSGESEIVLRQDNVNVSAPESSQSTSANHKQRRYQRLASKSRSSSVVNDGEQKTDNDNVNVNTDNVMTRDVASIHRALTGHRGESASSLPPSYPSRASGQISDNLARYDIVIEPDRSTISCEQSSARTITTNQRRNSASSSRIIEDLNVIDLPSGYKEISV